MTHAYSVFDTVTGEMLRSGQTPNPRDVLRQAWGKNERAFAGKWPRGRYDLGGSLPVLVEAEAQPEVTPSMVKGHAGRLLRETDWMRLRALDGGPDVPEDVKRYRSAVRERCAEIEAMSPIPEDYRDPKWWPQ